MTRAYQLAKGHPYIPCSLLPALLAIRLSELPGYEGARGEKSVELTLALLSPLLGNAEMSVSTSFDRRIMSAVKVSIASVISAVAAGFSSAQRLDLLFVVEIALPEYPCWIRLRLTLIVLSRSRYRRVKRRGDRKRRLFELRPFGDILDRGVGDIQQLLSELFDSVYRSRKVPQLTSSIAS